jgi:Phosphotransferase enzyme family
VTAAVETRAGALRLRRQLVTPRRIEVWTTSGPRGVAAARVLYRARRPRARIAGAALTRVLPVRGWRALPARLIQSVVGEIAAELGLRVDAAAALHARESQRWLFALTAVDGRGIFVKLGMLDDEGLPREATMMGELAASDATFGIPNLRWHGQRKGWFAVVTDIAKRKNPTAEPDLEDARSSACALASAKRGFVVHGDLAPWNIVPTETGLVLVDWEASRFETDPLFDLAHYVTRAGALLRAWRPEAAVLHLTGQKSVGWRYLEEIGLDPTSAAGHLARYLGRAESATQSPPVRKYEAAMTGALVSRNVRVR